MLKRARDILANEEGISIVFAVLLVVVLLVMGGVIVSYGYAGYSRAVSDNADERTYQNVASAAKFVRAEFVSEEDAQDAAIAAAGDDTAAAAAVSASGWGVDMLYALYSSAVGETATHKLQAAASDSNIQFGEITITIRKAAGASYDVICSESGNTSSTALKFSVGYDRVNNTVDDETITSYRLGTISSITRVGQ